MNARDEQGQRLRLRVQIAQEQAEVAQLKAQVAQLLAKRKAQAKAA